LVGFETGKAILGLNDLSEEEIDQLVNERVDKIKNKFDHETYQIERKEIDFEERLKEAEDE